MWAMRGRVMGEGPRVGVLAVTRWLWGCATSGGTAARGHANVFSWPPLSGQSVTSGHAVWCGTLLPRLRHAILTLPRKKSRDMFAATHLYKGSCGHSMTAF